MRAFVRVLPLFAAVALAACAATANNVPGGTSGATRHAALASPVQPGSRSTVRTARAVREPPDQALLKPQSPPQCELSTPLEGVPRDQAREAMLDYEQQCYRQRAEIAHARLATLQDAAAKTSSFESRDPALLERRPPPHCEPAKPSAGLSAVEAREATLDAARQCYKQLEASERQKLDALQEALRKTVNTRR